MKPIKIKTRPQKGGRGMSSLWGVPLFNYQLCVTSSQMALVPTIWFSELPLLALQANVYRISAPRVSLKKKKDTKFMFHFIRQDGNQHLLNISQMLETM